MSEKTKNRMITIRVSEDEFTSFRTLTRSMGYRSVSDLARAALHSVAGPGVAPPESIAERLDSIDLRVARLEKMTCVGHGE